MPVTAILFDLDDTLVPEAAAWSAAFRVACRPLAAEADVDVARIEASVFEVAAQMWAESPHADWCRELGLGSPSSLLSDIPGDSSELRVLRAWSERYRRQAWTQGLLDAGVSVPADVAALSSGFQFAFASSHRPFADVVPALRALRGTPLGILTNGFSDLQRSKLDRAGLESLFDVVVISSEQLAGKPDERVFRIALDALHVRPQDAVMVGDSLARDIDGARRAGLRAVWLQRGGYSHAPSDSHDRIDALAQLPDLIERYRMA